MSLDWVTMPPPSVAAAPPPPPPPQVVTFADFTYLGAFRVPKVTREGGPPLGGQINGMNNAGFIGHGIAYKPSTDTILTLGRQVTTNEADIIEFGIPTPVITSGTNRQQLADLPVAPLVHAFVPGCNDLEDSQRTNFNPLDAIQRMVVRDIHVREPWVYLNLGAWYNNSQLNYYHIARRPSDLTQPASSAQGLWRLTKPAAFGTGPWNHNMVAGHMLDLDPTFAATHFGGRDMACGYKVMQGTEGSSHGPSAWCFDPDALTPSFGSGVGYSSGADHEAYPLLYHPAGSTTEIQPWGPNGYWDRHTLVDLYNAAAWITTSDGRHCLWFGGNKGNRPEFYSSFKNDGGGSSPQCATVCEKLGCGGGGWYADIDDNPLNLNYQRYEQRSYFYDPNDLIPVFNGTALPYSPRPYLVDNIANIPNCSIGNSINNCNNADMRTNLTGPYFTASASFDSVNRRLFVCQCYGDLTSYTISIHHILIHVFQIS